MANMAYCRFSNTLEDLEDCYEHMSDTDISTAEAKARARLVELCQEITNNYADDLEITAA